jgi:hypothetical protein
MPAGCIALGADADPTTLSHAEQAAYRGFTNVITSRQANTIGFPVQRVAVGVHYEGAGVPSAVPVAIFLWDDSTQVWYRVQHASAVTVNINSITFVDTPSLLDFPSVQGQGLRPVGALELAIVASVPTTHPDGTYTIIAGCDVSNPGV